METVSEAADSLWLPLQSATQFQHYGRTKIHKCVYFCSCFLFLIIIIITNKCDMAVHSVGSV